MRKLLLSCFAALSLVCTSIAAAQPVEGQNYIKLATPVSTQAPDKIEVVELFWYGCQYCYQLEPSLDAWQKELPEDVNFVRIPAMFGGIWDLHAQLFYTLEALGVTEQVHNDIFSALHNRTHRLATAGEISNFVAQRGIDKESFDKAWNSFAVKSQLQKAKRLAIAYQVTGVPSLVVEGKYRFDIGSAGGIPQTLEVADFLIEQERATP